MVPKMRQYLILATAQGCNEAGAGGVRGRKKGHLPFKATPSEGVNQLAVKM